MNTVGNFPKILIIDDEPINIKVLNDLLSQDMQVIFATNGEDALLFAKTKEPDLILLDVMMPGMDGFEVCERLKANPDTAHIPVVFATALSSEADEHKGLELGAIDFVSKPYRPSIIKVRIKNHLKLKQQHDALDRLSRKLADEVLQLIEAEKAITHMATHDSLTQLPNRTLLMDRLQLSVDTAVRSNMTLSVLFLDLDGFKDVNDNLGHEFGDYILQDAALRMKKCVRKTDTVARLGGDEFVVLLVDVRGVSEIETVVEKMNDTLSQPFEMNGERATLSASIGISIFPDDASSPEELIKQADRAMYTAKQNGKNTFAFLDRKSRL